MLIIFIYRWIFPACNEEAGICKAVQDLPGHQNEWTWKTGIRIFFFYFRILQVIGTCSNGWCNGAGAEFFSFVKLYFV